MFSISIEEIRRLCAALQLPATTTSKNSTTWTAEEGLRILLRRLTYPCRSANLACIFGRLNPDLSVIINPVCSQICEKWAKLLTNFKKAARFSEDPLKSYADAVHTKCPLNNCWGFIDGTVQAICRPGLVKNASVQWP